jgi:hypothetical protein
MISSVRSLTPVDHLFMSVMPDINTKDEEDADLSRDGKEKMSCSILMNLRHEASASSKGNVSPANSRVTH